MSAVSAQGLDKKAGPRTYLELLDSGRHSDPANALPPYPHELYGGQRQR